MVIPGWRRFVGNLFPTARCAAGAGLAMLELCDTAGRLTVAVIAAGEAAGWALGPGRRVEPG